MIQRRGFCASVLGAVFAPLGLFKRRARPRGLSEADIDKLVEATQKKLREDYLDNYYAFTCSELAKGNSLVARGEEEGQSGGKP